jgi:hypothetical protein
LTVLRDDPLHLPLVESLQPFFSEVELDAILSQSDDLAATCLALLGACANRAVEFAEDDRSVVVAGLLNLVDRVEQKLKEHFTDRQYSNIKNPNAAIDLAICQSLYCALSEKQAIILPKQSIPTSEINRVVGTRLFPLLSNVAGIAKLLLPRIHDGSVQFHWNKPTLRAEKLRDHDLMVEAAINTLHGEEQEKRPGRPLTEDTAALTGLSQSAQKVIEVATGIDVSVLIDLLRNKMQILVDQGVAARHGGIVMIVSSRLLPDIRALFERLSFTVGRVKQFRAPNFFDSGPLREEPLPPGAAIVEAAAVNWSAYYPCFVMHSPGTSEPIYVTTPRMWQGMIMTLSQRPASLMQSLHDMLRRIEPASPKLPVMRELIRKTHQDLEVSVLKLATELGWKGLSGVERLRGLPLPCGEIDLLATALVGENRVILVAEVKNSDNPMFLPGFTERIGDLASHAENQLERKGNWVANNWYQALALLDEQAEPPGSRRMLARLIVTRRPLGAHFFKKFPGASPEGFQSIARDLLRTGDSVWTSPWRVHVEEVAS